MSDLYLFRSALKDLLRPKKLIVALVLVLIPSLLAILIRTTSTPVPPAPEELYAMLAPGVVFGFILVILSVVYGTGVITQEVGQKTIVYLLTHPVPRWRILLIKYAAAATVTTLIIWCASLLLAVIAFGPGGLKEEALWRDLAMLPVGALAYTGVFLLLSTILSRPLIWGLSFAFGWESWVPNMPGDFQKVSIMTYLRVLAPHAPSASTTDQGIQQLLTALSPQTITSSTAWMALSGVIVVALVAAALIFSTNEYVPREDVG